MTIVTALAVLIVGSRFGLSILPGHATLIIHLVLRRRIGLSSPFFTPLPGHLLGLV